MILLMLVGDKGEVSHSCTRVHDTGIVFLCASVKLYSSTV
jgi:hypothetical protein